MTRTAAASIRMASTWRQRAPSKREALRVMFSDGEWHRLPEMVEKGGNRYTARVFELHDDEKRPVHHQVRFPNGSDANPAYRQVEKRDCSVCRKRES